MNDKLDTREKLDAAVAKVSKHYAAVLSGQGTKGVVEDVYAVLSNFVATLTRIVLDSPVGSFAEKKKQVVDAALAFWRDTVRGTVLAALGDNWITASVVLPTLEKQLPAIVGGLFDSVSGLVSRLSGGDAARSFADSPL